MANIKSQIKRNRQTIKRTERNKAVRSEMKTRTKSATAGIAAGAENTAELLSVAAKKIDKAAVKGVIHKNAAARRKSRLMKKANAAANAAD
ncbi:MAG TPA: 30S ribosomal protein S20 [Acidimicrobiales bacterium]